MVDSTNLPEVDINQIATDLNGKMDRDCLNASDTGNIQMARASMPSGRYIDLTLSASGTTYTAPADGWIYWRKKASAVSQYIALMKTLDNNISIEASVMWSVAATSDLYANMPVRKGEVFRANYTAAGSSSFDFFRFVYAVGSESEAS